MSLVQSFGPTRARLAALAGMLALPLLAGCAYDDGYYGSAYDNDYGYYGGGYIYGGYGYGYGYYGNPCWPYGCGGWGHRHHRRHWDDDDGRSHHRHGGGDDGMSSRPRFDPGDQANDAPRPPQQPSTGNTEQGPRSRGAQSPSSPYVWIPQQRDSKR